MGNPIKDGAGSGSLAKVDNKNRLHIGSVSRAEKDAAISNGSFFITNSTVVTLTNSTDTPLIYIKNNDDRKLYVDLFLLSMGSSDGSGNSYVKTWAAIDDTSTIVTSARQAPVGNANLASTEQFNGDVFKGDVGDTMVGINFNTIITQPSTIFNTNVLSIFPKGTSGGFSFQAPTGNTSMEVILTITMYYLDEELPV